MFSKLKPVIKKTIFKKTTSKFFIIYIFNIYLIYRKLRAFKNNERY